MARRPWLLWVLAIVITLASAVWQRLTGPTYPVRGTVELGGTRIDLRLERSHGGAGDQPVRVVVADPAVRGDILWRRYPTSDPWQSLSMTREGDTLAGALPQQPPAGKLEYQVRLTRGQERVAFPARPAVTRFKGEVSPWLLVPHVGAMFLSMLAAAHAGLAALVRAPARRSAWVAIALLVLGGFVLGPAVQKQAFGEWWAGVPYGWDLTDNKTLLAAAAWLVAAWGMRGGRAARGPILFAAVTMLAVFAIPHSVWGSEIDWATYELPTQR